MLKLKKIRLKKGLTLRQLSDRSSVAIGYIGDLENGKSINPSLSTMNKLAQALDVPVSELLDEQLA